MTGIGVGMALWIGPLAGAADLTTWRARPASATPPERSASAVTLTGATWTHWVSPEVHEHPEVAVTLKVEKPASRFDFFGSSWSAWPDARFEDLGFEAGITLCESSDAKSGYRVQVSLRHQQVALVRFPDGGYLASVPCPLQPAVPIALDESLQLDPSLRRRWSGWQVRRPSEEGDPRPLLAELERGRPRLMLSTGFETGIGARWLHHLAALQAEGPTPAAPGLAPAWSPSGEQAAADPERVWEAVS
jgi:hypothetical protein